MKRTLLVLASLFLCVPVHADIIPGDMNLDGIVNMTDVDLFLPCMLGPGIPVQGGCRVGDTDLDGDVDLHNFAVLQVNFGT